MRQPAPAPSDPFLDALTAAWPAGATAGVARPNAAGQYTRRQRVPARRLAATAAEAAMRGEHLAVVPNPLSLGSESATEADLAAITAIALDLDEAGASLRDPSLPPTLLIESSPGRYWAVYLLTEPQLPTSAHRARAKIIGARLLERLGGDSRFSGFLVAPCPVPGTPPRPKPGRQIAEDWRVRLAASGEPYTWQVLAEAAGVGGPMIVGQGRRGGIGLPPGWSDVLARAWADKLAGVNPQVSRRWILAALTDYFLRRGADLSDIRELLDAWCAEQGEDRGLRTESDWSAAITSTAAHITSGGATRGLPWLAEALRAWGYEPPPVPESAGAAQQWGGWRVTDAEVQRLVKGQWLCAFGAPVLPVATLADDEGEQGVVVRVRGAERLVPGDLIAATRSAEGLSRVLGLVLTPEEGRSLQQLFAAAVRAGLPERRVITAPGWRGRTLLLPDSDTIMVSGGTVLGYGQVQGDPQEARDCWIRAIEAMPLSALMVVGHAFGSLLRAPLRQPTGILHLAGDSRVGKSATALLAAATVGPADEIVMTWDATAVGLERAAALARHLPLVIDEARATRLDDDELGRALFALAGGIARTRGTASGGLRTREQWTLGVLSTGERGLSRRIAELGLARRVLDWPVTDVPLWNAPNHEPRQVIEMIAGHHGWPLRWAAELLRDPAWLFAEQARRDLAAMVDKLVAQARLPDVLRDAAATLAVAHAGLTLLLRALLGFGRAEAKMAALTPEIEALAVRVLAAFAQDVEAEGGTSAGDRVYHALMDFFATNQDLFESVDGPNRTSVPIGRTVLGKVWLRDGKPERIAFTLHAAGLVARELGTGDTLPTPALRQLANDKRLIVGEAKRLQSTQRIGAASVRAYLLRARPLPDATSS